MTAKNIILSAILGVGFVATAAIAEPTDIECYADYEGIVNIGETQASAKPSNIDIVQFADYDGTHGSYGSAQPQPSGSAVAVWEYADYEGVFAATDSVSQPLPDELPEEYVVAVRDDEQNKGRLPWPLSSQS